MKNPVQVRRHHSAARPSLQPRIAEPRPGAERPPRTEPRPGAAQPAQRPAWQLPIVLPLPGLAGREWEDSELLQFLVEAITKNWAAMERLVLDSSKGDDWAMADQAELLVMARRLAASEAILAPTHLLDLRIGAVLMLPGLSSWQGQSTHDVLERFAHFLYSHRQAILEKVLPRVKGSEARLRLAESLVVAEAVQDRAGFATDAREGERSPVVCCACTLKGAMHLVELMDGKAVAK